MALTRDDEFWAAFIGHAELSVQASKLLIEMLEQPVRRQRLVLEVAELEHAGDRITRDTVLALHQTWITPLDREEIHGLISRLDDVLDLVDAAADSVALYEIMNVRPEALEMARILTLSCGEIAQAMRLLKGMEDARPLLALCKHINRHEHEADQLLRRALARLFREQTCPLELMKWRDILESLETATDRADDVANIIEGIALEHG